MHDSVKEFYKLQTEEIYEKAHGPRLDFLVKDLKLDEIKDSVIYDFGGGPGFIFKRLPNDAGNIYFVVDGADTKVSYGSQIQVDMNNPFALRVLVTRPNADVAFCFEVLEHLGNPYNCLSEIKDILKPDGLLYLSVPHISTTHNTLYPGLFYPVDNFKEFLGQMAFEIIEHRYHDKAFTQEVFILRNKSWEHSKLKFPKHEPKFRGLPPIGAINI